ncbi:MAG: patatin-like phospholipase family protein [Acidobacteriota bacterium]
MTTNRLTLLTIAILSGPLVAHAQGQGPGKSSDGAGRPRTCLVLSGGGARGAAHVGVLKVLEEMRIPIDCIAATSMGSIVGGLYASGASPEFLVDEFVGIDWDDALNDSPPRKHISFRRKEDDDEPLFRFELGIGRGGITLPSGLIAGQKLEFILRSLTMHASAIHDFDDLPIPFRAIATDLNNGEMVVLKGGDLADALRASMSVPGIFTPVELDGIMLIDGGIVRNFPVDVARAMGADRLIAVDVSTPPGGVGQDVNLFGVASQTSDLLAYRNVREQRALLTDEDLLIVPELTGVSFMNFHQVEEAMHRGEAAARAAADGLARFSVLEDEYAQFVAEHRRGAPRRVPEIRVDAIRVTGLDRVDPRIVNSRLKTRPGASIALDHLQEDLEKIYRIGEFEQVDFRILREGEASILEIDAREKSWGPGYLRFGLGLESDLAGDGEFTFVANYRRTHMNKLGAEWKSILKLGDVNGLFTEFFQPLDFSSFWFVAPQIEYLRDKDERFLDSGALALIDDKRLLGALDIGVQFRNYGEIRIGAGGGTLDIADLTSPGLPKSDIDLGGWRAKITIDQLDNAHFPREGGRAEAKLLLSRESLGADQAYDKLEVRTVYADSFGRHTFLGALAFGTDLGSDIPFYDEFRLGGFLNLSGLPRDRLQGDVSGNLAMIYYREIGRVNPNLGGGVYVGASLEAGNVWDDVGSAGFSDLRYAGLVFMGAETLMGPLYLGYGLSEGGEDSFYLFLGQLF